MEKFDPNGPGIKNGNFIGLPFSLEEAQIVFLPVPWDVTTSFSDGTSSGPENIREASYQLDLYDLDLEDAWKLGIHYLPTDEDLALDNHRLRQLAKSHIDFLEQGGKLEASEHLKEINEAGAELNQWVCNQTTKLMNDGKLVGLVGGDHSCPLGFIEALTKRYNDFGILQIDAHMDLRVAYEGFKFSHASIFYNALKFEEVSQLTQLGIRDCCEAEVELAETDKRINTVFDQELKKQVYKGWTFPFAINNVIKKLPNKVYISFDIDGLNPGLCPNTGTPVPGGFDFNQAIYILNAVVNSGRTIIGFDLSEVAGKGHDWDGNVGARILYKLANLMGKSQKLSPMYYYGE